MGPLGCTETSLRNYQCTLLIIAEYHRSHILHGVGLKSRILQHVQFRAEIFSTLISQIFKQFIIKFLINVLDLKYA